jgi:FAD/FMN-containing dehydrogenase
MSADRISRLRDLLPDGRIQSDPQAIAGIRRAAPPLADGRTPSCIAYPANPDELQALICYANEAGLNLTITSSSSFHRHGGIASAEENVLVDLSSWRKIDLIDRRNRVCRIEPGVTYGQLTAELAKENMVLPLPLAPRAGKSVLAAVMDRTPSTWPNKQWDAGDPAASTEFFFGTGDRFRTGAGGGPGTLAQQRQSGGAQKHPSGPSQTDFHRVIQGAQGTMGLVSWITVRTEIMPTVEKTLLASSERLEDLLPFVYAVQRGLLGEQTFILDRTAVALLLSEGDTKAYAAIREACPAYLCLQNVAGFERLSQERLDYHLQDIGALAKKHGLRLEERVGPVQAADLLARVTQPCGEVDWRDKLHGNSLSIFFLSTLDCSPSLINTLLKVAGDYGIPEDEIGTYIQPVVQNHACHLEFILPFDGRNEAETDRMRRFERQAVARLMEAGAFFSRPYGSATDLVWAQNPANYRLVKNIKGIFDPRRVLQRGKWGL